MAITGGCLCKAVRYSFSAEPIMARTCWCRLCQYLGAGNGTTNVVFPRESMTLTGELATYTCAAESGNIMHRRFCPTCGTPILSDGDARKHLAVVRVGTLDDPNLIAPKMTVWTKEAPTWACIDPRIAAVEGQS